VAHEFIAALSTQYDDIISWADMYSACMWQLSALSRVNENEVYTDRILCGRMDCQRILFGDTPRTTQP
jgi:hypothetical protein